MLKVAGIQFACSKDKEKNTELALSLAEMAVGKEAQILCFQELFNLRWFPSDTISAEAFAFAETAEGKTVSLMKDFAKKNKVVVVCPFFEKANDGVYYNSAAVIDADGMLLGLYRKTHIPEIPYWHEKHFFKPGNLGFPVFKTCYAKIGIQICWDIFFPEVSRILAYKGAQIIFAPTASDAVPSMPKWEKTLAANAITNGVFMFRVNRVGKEEFHEFYGNSFCLNPDGEIICGPSGMNDGILVAETDLTQISETRRIWPFLRDRREEIYGELTGFSWINNSDMPEEE
ncbi:MAG: N-carbamoylputrescine amidase [Candidatus Schekmanbacteria bacterium]|nr:N-carbamoylputrescine amidase [Candidatus Schekmanbacteria bacterium]